MQRCFEHATQFCAHCKKPQSLEKRIKAIVSRDEFVFEGPKIKPVLFVRAPRVSLVFCGEN
jgi:hypothetical protein